ncbi:endolysin [Colletotrichum kahawae]|uniref:Endolysin n=1 Tax=Colletotrichum kahawae TaxID=34407 RepID=A0AAD9YN46_COLKA|nr:endolysin [Colletotrichum kahawae]
MKTSSILFVAVSALAGLTEARRGCKPDVAHPGFGMYTIASGDNLNDIATDFGTTATQLATINSIPNPDQIKPGNTLVVPCR